MDFKELNTFISRLAVAEIEALTDQEITALAMERPGHPGQHGFMLNPGYFRSNKHLAQTMSALTERLGKALAPTAAASPDRSRGLH